MIYRILASIWLVIVLVPKTQQYHAPRPSMAVQWPRHEWRHLLKSCQYLPGFPSIRIFCPKGDNCATARSARAGLNSANPCHQTLLKRHQPLGLPKRHKSRQGFPPLACRAGFFRRQGICIGFGFTNFWAIISALSVILILAKSDESDLLIRAAVAQAHYPCCAAKNLRFRERKHIFFIERIKRLREITSQFKMLFLILTNRYMCGPIQQNSAIKLCKHKDQQLHFPVLASFFLKLVIRFNQPAARYS